MAKSKINWKQFGYESEEAYYNCTKMSYDNFGRGIPDDYMPVKIVENNHVDSNRVTPQKIYIVYNTEDYYQESVVKIFYDKEKAKKLVQELGEPFHHYEEYEIE
jgi:hypothetical protein